MASANSETGDQREAQYSSVQEPHAVANVMVSAYLSQHISEYRDLVELRREGWNNPSADVHFHNERSSADNPTDQQKDRFYRMTCQIGQELDSFLGHGRGILSVPFPPKQSISVLDLCMAPGGFSTAVLTNNPHHEVKIHGVTLPTSMGGYGVRIPGWKSDPRIAGIQFLDVTMLASEMGISAHDIPASHPDKESFITKSLFPDQQQDLKFDVIFCGGTIVRNHKQSDAYKSYRQGSEGKRLLTAQLVIAMKRIRVGGTLVIVLHRADSWTNVVLFYMFAKFSDGNKMRLFKPARAHARKGSFYLVVCGVDPGREEAREAVEAWRREWIVASMLDTGARTDAGLDGGGSGGVDDAGGEHGSLGRGVKIETGGPVGGDTVEAVLEEFGPQLVQLTRPVFKIQAGALRTAPWAGAGSSTRAG